MKAPKAEDQNYSERETKKRFDAMLKGALKSPPKPLKSIQSSGAKRKPVNTKKNESR